MSVNAKLLDILCCPHTKIPVEVMDKELLVELNEKIIAGEVTYVDGSEVTEQLTEALITKNREIIYQVDDDIPVMIYEKGILVE
ncbi:MAG: Trm112 family protein [Gammaproteobacteria bacterium]|nr:MAG: Trm112 family protein [Gammaproteobacteria bacterium]